YSLLWSAVKIFRLHQNMRVENDPEADEFKSFLLKIGNGTEKTINNDMIKVPDRIIIDWHNEQSIQTLIEQVYLTLSIDSSNPMYFTDKAILTTKNEYVDCINDTILNQLPNEGITYRSFDSVTDDTHNLYQQEFLNSINASEIPPHELHLKINTPIICLRNLDPINGLCNGTKLICKAFNLNVIEAEIATGNQRGRRIFLPQIPFMTSETRFPFTLKRKQFPVKLAFAMTINKSQGQTISHVGLYLPEHVFTHSQLYVAFSRVRSYRNIKVLIKNGKIPGRQGTYAKNVVYKEIL
ncbi:26218_t:CDS:1, partial [Gigaspora margarita]